MSSSHPPNLAPRQPSQPPVHPHQQSPLRKLLPGQSPVAPVRKGNETAVPTGASSVTGPSVHGAPEGHKLPPHLAALNPAVTKITYTPYTVSKTSESTDGAEDDKKSDDDSSHLEGDESKEVKKASIKVEDPVFSLTSSEVSTLKEVMAHDAAYEAIYRAKQNRMLHEMRTAGPASRLAWWDRDFAPHVGINRRPERFDVKYPRLPKNDGNVPRRKGARREGIRIPRRLPPELADRPEQLVPIRLEFDVEHHKMRDTFLWNLNDPVITPEMFAQTLVEDYSLLPSYHGTIVKSIQEQLSDFKAHMVDMDWKPPSSAIETTQSEDPKIEELDESGLEDKVDCRTLDRAEYVPDNDRESPIIGKGTLDDEEVRWWESWRKRCRKEAFSRSPTLNSRRKKRKVVAGAASNSEISITKDDNAPRTVDEFELDEKKMHEDLRILIKLDIIVGSVRLDDQFEWDLENEDASPEQFAEVYVKELGLGGEFQTAISHCIREQVHVYQKSLFLVGHPGDGSPVQDEDLRMAFLPSLTSGTRSIDQVPSYTPILNYMSDGDIERSEKEREKELARRRKRNTRGRRGIPLPDREPNRTYRTPAIGFPELDAATLALAAAANAPTSRRAAAAAASLTIANMVASENGTPIMPLQLPQQQPTPMLTTTPGKEKKAKWLFKPPSYPSSVLRPRAKVNALTPSTAVESTSMLPSSLLDKEPPPPVANPPPPDSKTAAKKAREAEREAKEKELADGQHANHINGVWHCSNCGCPESIAIGRRKGPLGDKSQVWPLRRLRPVEYNSDPQYHLNLRNETEQTKTGTKKRGRAPNSNAVAEGNETPSRQKSEVAAPPPVTSTALPSDDRPVSPVTSASSGDEAPLAQQSLKINGASQQPAASSRAGTPDSPRPLPDTQLTSPGEPGSASAAPYSNGSTTLPVWLTAAMHDLQAKYPDDKFEAILRKPAPKAVPEWRIKCLDCPGKLYNPGPGDTLSNYEVHLRNRQHRSRVNNRLNSSFA
ncbi:SNF5-domain-containing protein [Pisolithus marmoratus]|nr:SNF5-domain-containing protein [Pisolithus marmoratus]